MAKKARRQETMDKGDVSLDKLILEHKAFNRVEGKTEKTIRWHNLSLNAFLQRLQRVGHSALLKDLDLETARLYVLHLQKRPKFEDHPYVPTQQARLAPISVDNPRGPCGPFSTGGTGKATPWFRPWRASGPPKLPAL